ncbi:DUF1206 domain-containing protein [Leifsonia shinshuensis]|uniref:DUF1206 domain-containing protein n=1 Tax=Leifsonia shinshuensis TaxID=150026 RepID=UPI001F504ED9|nr:DUF1206 domain-containing protein [Leifsonia shinshuensis]MCI0158913.1 DUF1206 domain-containing protein [Leifsonia shinshuensis]
MSAGSSGATADAGAELRNAVRTAGDSRFLEVPARVGFAASGLIQVLLGGLAIQLGASRVGEPDQTGALEEVSKLPGGFVVLWVAAIGLFALALWLLTEAILVRAGSAADRWMRRLEHLSKAAAYAVLGFTALAFADGHPSNASTRTSHASGSILSSPGGQVLLAVLGLVTGAVGVYFVAKGIRLRFRRDIAVPSGPAGRGITVLGAVGYVAKGIVVGLAGAAFIVAAVRVQPATATGLAGGLSTLEQLPFGGAIVVVVGFGLIASGVYNIARAWLARF